MAAQLQKAASGTPAEVSMDNLIDRLWNLIVGAKGLAPSAVHSPEVTSLQMCYPGIPIQPESLKNMKTQFNPNGDLAPTEAFSRWVDRIPDVTKLTFKPTSSTFEDAFEKVVSTANSDAPPPSQDQIDAYNKARSYLFKKAINPFTGKEDDQETETETYLNYKKKRNAYQTALSNLTSAWTLYDLSRPEDQRKWLAEGQKLQQAVDNAWDDWNGANKTYVEQALDLLGTSLRNMVAHAITTAQKVYDSTALPSLSDPTTKIHYSYGFPDKWWEMKASGFTKLTVKSDYNYLHTESHTKTAGSSGSFLGLFSFGGSGGWTKTTTKEEQVSRNISVELEVAAIDIIRPWASTTFLKCNNWYLSGEKAGRVSSGKVGKQSNKMFIPLMPVQFIVARNIVLSGDWSKETKETMQQKINAGTSCGYGPFKISGKYEQSDQASTMESRFEGNALHVAGLQIIGFVSNVPPFSPPKDDPNLS